MILKAFCMHSLVTRCFTVIRISRIIFSQVFVHYCSPVTEPHCLGNTPNAFDLGSFWHILYCLFGQLDQMIMESIGLLPGVQLLS